MTCAILVTTVLTLTPAHPGHVRSLPPAKLPSLTSLIDVAGLLLDLADKATTRVGDPAVRAPRSPQLVAVEWRVVYRVPRVEVADYLTNEVIGVEVPGRRVTATICTDLLVYFTLEASKVQVRHDPDYPEITEVVLPAPKVTTGFPEGELADYTVDYGALRVPFLNREMAADLRTRMYGKAKETVRELYGKEVQPALQDDLVRDLRKQLRKQFPGKRIYIRFGS